MLQTTTKLNEAGFFTHRISSVLNEKQQVLLPSENVLKLVTQQYAGYINS